MRYTIPIALMTFAGHLLAGGFWLQLGNPEASPEARKAHAVLTIQAVGCHDPATAQVRATAIGIVDGRRQEIPLKVTPLAGAGRFAISRQWPAAGRWVIQLTGTNGEQFTNSLVPATADGVDRAHARADMKHFTPSDVAAMLE